MVNKMGYYDNCLEHHGIKGQRWGVRRFQNKDGTRTAAGKARANENSSSDAHKGLTDKQKKALKIGAAVVGASLVAAGGVYLYKTGKIGNSGKQYIESHDWGSYDAGDVFRNSSNSNIQLSEKTMRMAINKNPYGRKDNCKEVSHAFCESMYSNDPKVIAGKKPRFVGSLYDYATQKLGWPDSSVRMVSGNSPTELKNNVTKQITRRFSEGDYGMIGFNADPKIKERQIKLGLISENDSSIDGHCFNWIFEDGQVKFFDCQPEGGPRDASNYFNSADLSKEVELLCYNRSKS